MSERKAARAISAEELAMINSVPVHGAYSGEEISAEGVSIPFSEENVFTEDEIKDVSNDAILASLAFDVGWLLPDDDPNQNVCPWGLWTRDDTSTLDCDPSPQNPFTLGAPLINRYIRAIAVIDFLEECGNDLRAEREANDRPEMSQTGDDPVEKPGSWSYSTMIAAHHIPTWMRAEMLVDHRDRDWVDWYQHATMEGARGPENEHGRPEGHIDLDFQYYTGGSINSGHGNGFGWMNNCSNSDRGNHEADDQKPSLTIGINHGGDVRWFGLNPAYFYRMDGGACGTMAVISTGFTDGSHDMRTITELAEQRGLIGDGGVWASHFASHKPFWTHHQGQSTSVSINEFRDQLRADLNFLQLRKDRVAETMLSTALTAASADDATEALERLGELQRTPEDELSAQEAAELAQLTEAFTPSGVADAASQAERLAELRANGEVGQYAAAMRAMEQCYLLRNIIELGTANVRRSRNGETGYRIEDGCTAHMVQGDTGQIVSKLMFDPAYSAFYWMTPDKLSYLVPRLRLYQVLHEVVDPSHVVGAVVRPEDIIQLSKPINFEIPFFQHITQHSVNEIMDGTFGGRGGALNIKSFDWEYQGSNPASSRRDIKATLELECQTFDELIRRRTAQIPVDPAEVEGGEITHEWMYGDLAIRRNRNHRVQADVLYQQTKVVVGWGLADNLTEEETLRFSDEELDAIKNSQTTMFLTLIDHAFDIRDDGTVGFKLEYRAWIEGAFTSPTANVLITPDLLEAQTDRRRLEAEMNSDIADPNGLCRQEDLHELRRRFAQSIASEKEQAHLSLLRGLETHEDGSKLFIWNMTMGDMASFMDSPFSTIESGGDLAQSQENPEAGAIERQDTGVVSNLEDLLDSSSDEDSTDEILQNIYTDWNEGEYNIVYFYLGDLINVALRNIDEADSFEATQLSEETRPKKFNKTRLLLGPLEISDPDRVDVRYQINLADVPISVNYFLEWFISRIAAKQDVIWYVVDFIKDCIRNMVYNILNSDDCFGGAIRQRANFQNIYLCGRGGNDIDKVQALIDGAADNTLTKTFKRLHLTEYDPQATPGVPFPILDMDKSDEAIPAEQMYHYILLYAADPQPSELSGDFGEDVQRGIYHFHVGTNRGTVKRMRFQKTDQPGLREARYFSQGYDGLSQLREPYKIDIEMYGNSRIFPGQTVYINPRGLGYSMGLPHEEDSVAWMMGLGGYYMVINAKHVLARGKFDTKINCVWVLRGGPGGEVDQSDGSGTPARNVGACEVLANSGLPPAPPSGGTTDD